MKKQLLGLALVVLPVLSGFATTCYWGAGDGWWDEASSWSSSIRPQSLSDATIFDPKTDSSVVGFRDASKAGLYVWLRPVKEAGVEVTDNNGPFAGDVVFKGNGQTLDLAQSFTVDYRRRLVVDNLTVNSCQTGTGANFTLRGKAVFRNKSALNVPMTATGNYGGPVAEGAELYIDDSDVNFWAFGGSKGKITIKNGGSLSYPYNYIQAPDAWKFYNMDINVIDGDVNHNWCDCFTVGFLPKRSGTFTTTSSFRPYLTDDMKIRLGGSAVATNVSLYVTNNVAFYGRGKLQAVNLSVDSGKTCTMDVSEYVTGDNRIYSTTPVVHWLGDTDFGWTYRMSGSSVSPAMAMRGRFRGVKTFHCSDVGTACDWNVNCPNVENGTGVRFVDGVASTKTQDLTMSPSVRFRTLEVGDDITMNASWPYYSLIRTHDFRLGARARVTTDYFYQKFSAIGAVEVDPTARIAAWADARSAGAEPTMMFCSLDADFPESVIEPTTTTEGCYVQRVGGSYFYWDGTASTSVGWYTWKGQTDGYWSHSNWQSYKPNAENGANFALYYHTECTNDFENFSTPYLHFANFSGPFILRGNPVELTANGVETVADSAIASQSRYPQIIELDITSQQPVLGVTTAVGGCDQSVICLRGDVSVPNGAFAPCGDVVIDGTVTAKELAMKNYLFSIYPTSGGHYAWQRPTVLTVRKTGTVNIAAQSAAHSTTSSLWIAKGGALNITGDWVWNSVTNEHLIDGTLAVSGAIGGTASQYYGGKGTLKAGTTDGSAGAKLRVGEGLTLVPTGADFGTMPIEIAYGNAGFATENDTEVKQTVDVAALGSVVTVSNDHALVFSGTLSGYDFDLVKKGAGRLTLKTTADSSGRGFLTVEQGSFAWTKPQSFGRLTTKPGTKLVFAADKGAFVPMTLGDSVDLTGVDLAPADETTREVARKGYQPILSVPEYCSITGLTAPDGLRVRTVPQADGSTVLEVKAHDGLMLIVR